MGGGPLAAGAPSHGTTGTMDNPALRVTQRRVYNERDRPNEKLRQYSSCYDVKLSILSTQLFVIFSFSIDLASLQSVHGWPHHTGKTLEILCTTMKKV